MDNVSIVIQAGGKSSRMGRDKTFLQIHGKPLIHLIIEKVSIMGDDLIITSNDPSKFSGIDANVVQDEYPGFGAMAGLHAGIKAAKNDLVIIVANDMPFINMDLFFYMLQLFQPGTDLVIPHTERGYEPFHAIYRKSTCLPAIEKAILNQERKVISWFDGVNLVKVEDPVLEEFDPGRRAFLNVNTPDDLALAEKLFR